VTGAFHVARILECLSLLIFARGDAVGVNDAEFASFCSSLHFEFADWCREGIRAPLEQSPLI
jgi:hypothetical protein